MDQSQGETVPDQGGNPMRFARRPEPHASEDPSVTSDDLVPRILAAIEEVERDARDARTNRSGVWRHVVTPGLQNKVVDDLDYTVTGHYHDDSAPWWNCPHIARNDPDAVLRRCAADREIVELHHIVWREIGWLAEEDGEVVEEEAELPVCGLCVERHSNFPRREDVPVGPCRTVRLLARGYGISAEEATGE